MKADLEKAVSAHREGRLDEARRRYEAILLRRPSDPDALNFLGVLEFQSGNPTRAIVRLRRSLAVDANNPHAWINLGNVLSAEEGAAAAVAAYERALALERRSPEAWFNLGICQRRLGRFDSACASLRRAIEQRRSYADAYRALGSLLYRLERVAEANLVYRDWLAADPKDPIAIHLVAATSGDAVPARAGDEFVAAVFDQFAASFDASLMALGYRAPQLVAESLVLHPHFGSGKMRILDAGCGTGLCGPLLRSSAGHLTGVDLSQGMLDRAQARDVYDELVTEELTAHLATHAGEYDAIACADTLCYFGDLHPVLDAACAALTAEGVFIFTVEALEQEPATPYALRPHGRFAHGAPYLTEAAARAGLDLIALELVVLRKEAGADVRGWLAVAARATSRHARTRPDLAAIDAGD